MGNKSSSHPSRRVTVSKGRKTTISSEGDFLDIDLYLELEKKTFWKRYQIRQLHSKFKQLSKDKSIISRETFMKVFIEGGALPAGPVSERAFALFDNNEDGAIHFEEFVMALALCCSELDSTRLKFIFDVYASNNDPVMTRAELVLFLESVAGPLNAPSPAHLRPPVEEDEEQENSTSSPLPPSSPDVHRLSAATPTSKGSADSLSSGILEFSVEVTHDDLSFNRGLRRTASESVRTFQDCESSEFARSCRELLAFVDHNHGGKIPFTCFASWAKDHIEVFRILEKFEILLSISDERDTIRRIVASSDRDKVGSSFCLIDYKWWELWTEYVGFYDVKDDVIVEDLPCVQRPMSIDNLSLVTSAVLILKQDIEENEDFKLVPLQAWNCLRDWYGGGPTLERRVIQVSKRLTRVEFYPIFLQPWKVVGKRLVAVPRQESGNKLVLCLNTQTTFETLFESACTKMKVPMPRSRFWIGDGGRNWKRLDFPRYADGNIPRLEDVTVGRRSAIRSPFASGRSPFRSSHGNAESTRRAATAAKSNSSRVSTSLSARARGRDDVAGTVHFIDPRDALEDLQFSNETAILIETAEKDGRWPMVEYMLLKMEWLTFAKGGGVDTKDTKGKWYFTTIKDTKIDEESGKTKEVLICFNEKISKWDTWISTDSICKCPQHKCSCKNRMAPPKSHSVKKSSMQADAQPTSRFHRIGWKRAENIQSEDSLPGVVGLFNLGNTCFMNSSLQCLSSTPNLTSYFLSNRYIDEINKKNPLGTGGKLVTQYATLLTDLWNAQYSVVAPSAFKKALGRIAPQFSGFQQHDCHELLAYLLDGLHEDINRVQEKPLTETVESGGRPDDVVAKLAWEVHLQRNQSIIVDIFQAQLRSQVVGTHPDCGHESITFDPYMNLSVPLPRTTGVSYHMYIFRLDAEPLHVVARVPARTTVARLKQCVAEMAGLEGRQVTFSNVIKNRIFHIFMKGHNTVEHLSPRDMYVVFEDDPKLFEKREEDQLPPTISATTVTHELPFAERSHSNRFGLPFLIVFSGMLTRAKLWRHFWRRLSIYFPPDYTTEDLPFVLCAFDKSRTKCAVCLERSCDGCDLSNSSSQEIIPPGSQVVVRWNDDFVPTIKSRMVEQVEVHASVRAENDRVKKLQQAISLQDCLKLFTTEENLTGNDAWYCNQCRDFRDATKKIDIWNFPEILVIHLKRFRISRPGCREKIGLNVDFPMNGLDLRQFALSPSLTTPPVYDLFAVSNHMGGCGGGHYTATCKNLQSGEWWYFNDRSCTRRSVEEVKSNAAYVLFYRRRH
eukprot:275856_1